MPCEAANASALRRREAKRRQLFVPTSHLAPRIPLHPAASPTGARVTLHLPSPVRAARNFKLLDELEDAEKSAKGGADVSLGLQRPDDAMLRDWQASIFQSPVRLGDTLRGRASRGQRGRDAGAGDCASERLATNIF